MICFTITSRVTNDISRMRFTRSSVTFSFTKSYPDKLSATTDIKSQRQWWKQKEHTTEEGKFKIRQRGDKTIHFIKPTYWPALAAADIDKFERQPRIFSWPKFDTYVKYGTRLACETQLANAMYS